MNCPCVDEGVVFCAGCLVCVRGISGFVSLTLRFNQWSLLPQLVEVKICAQFGTLDQTYGHFIMHYYNTDVKVKNNPGDIIHEGLVYLTPTGCWNFGELYHTTATTYSW